MNHKIKNAWEDGSYFNNIKQVFEKIECSPNTVKILELWGGEPLIQLKSLNNSIGQIINYFKNLNFILIPTNFAHTNIKDLVTFLRIIDVNRTSKNLLNIHLQLSIDGPPGPFSENGHFTEWDNYKKNIEDLCKEISINHLNHIQIFFEIHGTANKDNIFKFLNTEEKMYNYIKYMLDFEKFIQDNIEKYNIFEFFHSQSIILPIIAFPSQFNREDALEFTKIIKLADKMRYYFPKNVKYGEHLAYWMTRPVSVASILNRNAQCSESNETSIVINYDGTICECCASYIQNNEEYLKLLLEQNKINEYEISLIRSKYFINPLQVKNPEEIEDFNWYVLSGLRNTESTQISLAMAMIQELALSNQVDDKYILNRDILLKHATIAAQMYNCDREEINDTKIPFLCSINECRKFFNGLLDFVASVRADEGKFSVETIVKNDFQ